jgi:hypothetical protein
MTQEQINWINKADGVLGKEYLNTRLDYFENNAMYIANDLIVFEKSPKDFMANWHNKADKHIIDKINWSALNQCSVCGEYYDDECCEEE